MNIYPIKAFSDNYIWVVEENENVFVVDPGEGRQVLEHLEKKQLNLTAILLTHHHDDHIGGVEEIVSAHPDTNIYGPSETNALNDFTVADGDTFELFGKNIQVSKTAGHTEEHISFLMGDALFCGDALFSGGCGRVFTGDYQAQFNALQIFNQLDDQVQVYAGHEYTVTNLRFANTVEPNNQKVARALEEVETIRQDKKPTLPSTIGREKEINLFMRANTLEEFVELRDGRDKF